VADARTVAASVHRWARLISLYVSAVLKAEALSDFDKARNEWESALAQVPDEALAYLKPGDDYALGGLQVHVNWVLVHYRRVLDGLIAGDFAPLGPQDPPAEHDEVNKKAKAGLTANGRREALAKMAGLHESVRESANGLPDESWSRKAPVVYGAGQDPYPTSAEDIIGWLRDHYREHVEQCPELVASWRAGG
jgi:DinB superfamily